MTRPTATFHLVHGAYVLDVPCPGCGATDGWSCRPGDWPACWRCGVKVLTFGRTPSADCVTPNGRVDSHGAYVRQSGGKLVCAFCGEPL